jgi:hypothetical protein
VRIYGSENKLAAFVGVQHCRLKKRTACKPVESKEFLADFTSLVDSLMDGGWQRLVRSGKEVKRFDGGPQYKMFSIKKTSGCVRLVARRNRSVSGGWR